MSAEIEFLGAAGTVTGSKYLIRSHGKKILVDCGLFQGVKSLRLKNWDGFPVDASDIDCILLTHAHIDHSGYIPRLIRKGFRGKIYSTQATRDLCEILLPDCGHLQEEEAEYLNRHRRSKHSPALPLFTAEEGERAVRFFEPVPFRTKTTLPGAPEIQFEFLYAGHILGAAALVLHLGAVKIIFSGDVGRSQDRLFFPPDPLPPADYLVIESTYGNRLHGLEDPVETLARVVNETSQKKGVVVIPAFAVGRAQSIMHYLALLRRQGKIPLIPMFLNSPMATNFSVLFRHYPELHKLSKEDCDEISTVMSFVHTVEESKALNQKKGPMVIISASGMLTGGRVLHHLKAFAPYPENAILLSGFQAAGTRGEALQRGETEIKIHGEYVPVRARVEVLDNMSAHADYQEMIDWLSRSNLSPTKVFVTHGEASAADSFRRRLEEKFGWQCSVPELGEIVALNQNKEKV
jgi:metallo-beta-lactamase family protein